MNWSVSQTPIKFLIIGLKIPKLIHDRDKPESLILVPTVVGDMTDCCHKLFSDGSQLPSGK